MAGPWDGAEMLHQGAEAIVHAGTWMGEEAVLKQRQPRKWARVERSIQGRSNNTVQKRRWFRYDRDGHFHSDDTGHFCN